jgi:hypothetical protein
MYDSEFICTYKMMDSEEDQEQLYKIQLLQAFNLEEWNDEVINDTMVELFNLMKLDSNLDKILLSLSKVESLQKVINMANECIDMNHNTSRADTSTSEADTDTSEADTSTSEADTDTSAEDTSTSAEDTYTSAASADIEFNKKMVLFGLLFQFEYFHLFHRCIYDFIHLWYITDKNVNALIETFV